MPIRTLAFVRIVLAVLVVLALSTSVRSPTIAQPLPYKGMWISAEDWPACPNRGPLGSR
ncbi:MAG: hypothetical protein Q9O62_02870 [Ardenticatenia bacterium]|nr:hypothetical protein [Ardenticatenia bacterium]